MLQKLSAPPNDPDEDDSRYLPESVDEDDNISAEVRALMARSVLWTHYLFPKPLITL